MIAFFNFSTIYELVMYSWAGLGASFGPLVLLSLYSKKVNRHGAVAAILVGAVTTGVWKNINTLFSFKIPELIPAFILSLIAAFLFSHFSRTKFSPHSTH